MTTRTTARSIGALEQDVRRLLIPRISAYDVFSPEYRSSLNAEDVDGQHIEQSVIKVLVNFCDENDIQPENLISCISMLQVGWCMLHAGSPVFMMGYSTTRSTSTHGHKQ